MLTRYEIQIYWSALRDRAAGWGKLCLAHPWISAGAFFLLAGTVAAVVAVKSLTVAMDTPVLLKAGAEGSVDVEIPAGTSVRGAAQLIAEKMDVTPETMMKAFRQTGNLVQAGRYRFGNNETLASVTDRLASGDVVKGTFRVADGMTVWQLKSALEANPDIELTLKGKTEAEILAAIGAEEKSLEGLFAPETYHFNGGMTDLAILKIAYQHQKKISSDAWAKRQANLWIKTPYEALILASLIEKETAHPEDRGLVSSVFHNRLKIRMPLQTDPTIIYALGENFDGVIRRSDLNRPGPYNTYKNYGLPPTPIAMPGAASIEAALNPAKTKYLYFVARGDGTTQFSTRLESHNRAVNQYQRGGR